MERSFAWISKHRRWIHDDETLPACHEAMVYLAMFAIISRRLAPIADTDWLAAPDPPAAPHVHRKDPPERTRFPAQPSIYFRSQSWISVHPDKRVTPAAALFLASLGSHRLIREVRPRHRPPAGQLIPIRRRG